MTKQEIIEFYRRPGETRYQAVKRVAELMRYGPTAIYNWPSRLCGRYWPYQAAFQILTAGRLRANLDEREQPTPPRLTAAERERERLADAHDEVAVDLERHQAQQRVVEAQGAPA